MTVSTRKLNIEYGIVQALYWMGFCTCVGFATVFLQSRGYSNLSLGFVLALGNVLGFFLSTCLAQIVDRGKSLNVFQCLWLLMISQLVLLIAIHFTKGESMLLSVLYCLFIACNLSVNPMNTQLCFELDGWSGRINYGATRGMGCVGYAPMAILLGSLTERMGADIVPHAALLVLALECIVLAALTIQNRKGEGSARPAAASSGSSLSTLGFIRSNPRFAVLLLGMALIFFTHNLSNNFLINVVRNVGGNTSVMGTLSGYTALMELPMMMLYTVAARRIRCPSLLRFSVVMFVAKSLSLALAPSVGWLFGAQSLQGLSFALLTPATVQYTSLVVGPRDSAKGQALAYSVTNLGTAFAGALGGIMYDSMSVRATLLIGTAVCAAGAVLCETGIDSRRS